MIRMTLDKYPINILVIYSILIFINWFTGKIVIFIMTVTEYELFKYIVQCIKTGVWAFRFFCIQVFWINVKYEKHEFYLLVRLSH